MTVIHWFRNDLRIHDHRVLGNLPSECDALLCVYVVDPAMWRSTSIGVPKTGGIRTQFLLESLLDLDRSLQACGSQLLICTGDPADVLAELARMTNAAMITTDAEVTSEECAADARVRAAIDVPLHRAWSRTMIHPDDMPYHINEIPETFTAWHRALERSLHVRAELPTPSSLPPCPLSAMHLKSDVALLTKHATVVHDVRTAFPFHGGESAGLERLRSYVDVHGRIASYNDTRNGLIGSEYSSKLSAWMAVGAVSARRVYHAVRQYEQQRGVSDGTTGFILELLWRDYFRFIAMKHGTRMFHRNGMSTMPTSWRRDREVFAAWCNGTTGDDFVDANMRELRATGWMSNRGRQNVASWLTKTQRIDWRWGAMWFEHALVDYDVCSNWGNWAYVAGVGQDPRRDRVFNTVRQAEMYDADGAYRCHWNNT